MIDSSNVVIGFRRRRHRDRAFVPAFDAVFDRTSVRSFVAACIRHEQAKGNVRLRR
jgi:hypothetical protein